MIHLIKNLIPWLKKNDFDVQESNQLIRTPEDVRKILESTGTVVIQHNCGAGIVFFEHVPDKEFDEFFHC